MDNTSDLPGKQMLDDAALAAASKQRDARAAQTRLRAALALWMVGFIALLAVSVIVLFHPAPWPFDLQTTIAVQHLQLWPWVSTPIVWASIVGDPIPSTVSSILWFVVLALIGAVVWLRGGSPVRWFVSAIFISLGTAAAGGLDGIINLIVSRPRPSSPLIHIYMPEPVHSFPSGHVENDVVYYGFLLYLSLSKPINKWRYRWILIPFQLYAVMNILLIGFSRVMEGSHWLTDVLGGYLAGAVWLVLLIFLYRWTLDRMTKWYDKRLAEKSKSMQA